MKVSNCFETALTSEKRETGESCSLRKLLFHSSRPDTKHSKYFQCIKDERRMLQYNVWLRKRTSFKFISISGMKLVSLNEASI